MRNIGRDFVEHVVLEPLAITLIGVVRAGMGVITLAWTCVTGFFLLGWAVYSLECVLLLLFGNMKGAGGYAHVIGFWFFFGGLFVCSLIARRAAGYPWRLLNLWVKARQAAKDAPFIDLPPGSVLPYGRQ